jgi:glycosyltransferase involved in cell wall biosynthesis
MTFFEETSDDQEYKHKILVYPNITFQSDLEKDSFIVVIGNIIKNLALARDDLFWTLILPKSVPSLQLDNTEQLFYGYPSYPNSMRCHFDFDEIMKLVQWKKNDYDIVYSHLPEHTLQLKNLFYNTTNCKPVFIGYTHWSEFPEITNYEQTLLDVNLLGLSEMVECGVNTIGQKNLILKNAKTNFNDKFVEKLDEIVQPHYLGWEIPQYDRKLIHKIKVIAFNHRPHEYKSYPWFLKMMDKLWETRTDFRVWVPLADKAERDYMYVGNNKTRHEYLNHLAGCWFGVSGKQKYAGWAISATDGMSVGVPYLFADADYYHELAGDAGTYFGDDEDFLIEANCLLDSEGDRQVMSTLSMDRFSENTWDKSIDQFNKLIDKAADNYDIIREPTESFMKMVEFIENKGSVSKQQLLEYMGWGVRINFTPYRNRLRQHPNIIFKKGRYEANSNSH